MKTLIKNGRITTAINDYLDDSLIEDKLSAKADFTAMSFARE